MKYRDIKGVMQARTGLFFMIRQRVKEKAMQPESCYIKMLKEEQISKFLSPII